MIDLFDENRQQLKIEGEICVVFYFISFSLVIYLWSKLIYRVECVLKQILVAKDA